MGKRSYEQGGREMQLVRNRETTDAALEVVTNGTMALAAYATASWVFCELAHPDWRFRALAAGFSAVPVAGLVGLAIGIVKYMLTAGRPR